MLVRLKNFVDKLRRLISQMLFYKNLFVINYSIVYLSLSADTVTACKLG